MSVVNYFNKDENFWTMNPQCTAAGVFKEVYEEDKSKGKKVSSSLMWSIALIYDHKSTFYNLPEEGEDNKVDLIFDDVYGDVTWPSKNKELFEKLRDFYRLLNETPAQRALRGVEEKLIERDIFLKATVYTMGIPGERGGWIGNTADVLDKMFSNTQKLWDLYEKARKQVLQETEGASKIGGRKESLTDQGWG